MRKFLILAILFVSGLATAQTFQVQTTQAVQAGQCIELTNPGIFAPCDKLFNSNPPAVAVGVALNTVPAAPRGQSNTITIQYAGLAIVPNVAMAITPMTPGDLLGDIDGTGNLNDLGPASTFCCGPTAYVGIFYGYANNQQTMIALIVQPGYVFPSPSPASPSFSIKRKK